MDRARLFDFIPAVNPPERRSGEPAWWFVVRGTELLVLNDDTGASLLPHWPALDTLETAAVRSNYLGVLSGESVFAVELTETFEPPPDMRSIGLRDLYGLLDDRLWALAGRALQIVEWDRTHQFCGRCGSRMTYADSERAKRCPACGLTSFPRISPAVITLIERGDAVLLARGPQFAPGRYALVAGFVEPGESLEEAVAREIKEEVGVDVDRITYSGSQPWPFPHSIMLGFTAQYAGGEIAIDGTEIEDARWFTPQTLPLLPQRLSIARRLIDAYAAKHGITIDQP